MSRLFLTPLDLNQNELQNARVQNLASAPTSPAPVKGQMYFNSTDNTLYWYNGTGWTQASGGAVSFGATTAETTFGQATNNGVATTVARSDHTHGTPAHDNTAHGSIALSALAVPTGSINLNSQKIINLLGPTTGTDAANKDYVDTVAQGLDTKASVRVATTANHGLTGLTAIDGVTPIAGDRVLVKNQTTQSANGIYVAASGAWTRATDYDSSAEASPGSYVFVEEGSTQADTGWVMTANAPVTLGTTALTWAQFNGAGAVVAGAGLTLTGTTLDVGAGSGISVAADSISLDTTFGDGRYMRRFVANCAAATSTVINHGLNTRDVLVDVYRNSTPWDTVDCDVERTDANNVTIRFAVAPAANAFRAVITG